MIVRRKKLKRFFHLYIFFNKKRHLNFYDVLNSFWGIDAAMKLVPRSFLCLNRLKQFQVFKRKLEKNVKESF